MAMGDTPFAFTVCKLLRKRNNSPESSNNLHEVMGLLHGQEVMFF